MRADRLVAILMLLQTRGQVTARDVATELEISERTARRDLDALGMAGLPIYSMQGRNGGWRLAGGGKTDLSGLTATEAQALFVLAGPTPASAELRAALRKLVRALPEPLRERADAAAGAVYHDRLGWGGRGSELRRPPMLDTLEEAVISRRRAIVHYVDRSGAATTREVHPLGVATKGASWYLIAGTDAGQRTFRVDRMQSVVVTDLPVVRPEGFVLADAWKLIAENVEAARTPVTARLLARHDVMPWLRHLFGARLRVGGAIDDGRVEVEVRGHSPRSVGAELAALGARVEVIEPTEVRTELARLAQELGALYG